MRDVSSERSRTLLDDRPPLERAALHRCALRRQGVGTARALPGSVQRSWRLIAGVLALALVTPGGGHAVEPLPRAPGSPASVPDWSTGSAKSYLVPALEAPSFLWLLNRYDRAVYGSDVYGTSWNTGWRHVVDGPWTLDTDPFPTNMIMHPYMGSMTHGFARSAQLDYWESLGYTLAASFLWETYREIGPPSMQRRDDDRRRGVLPGRGALPDGQPRPRGQRLEPGFWRELGAAALSPSTGLNRETLRANGSRRCGRQRPRRLHAPSPRRELDRARDGPGRGEHIEYGRRWAPRRRWRSFVGVRIRCSRKCTSLRRPSICA